MAQSASRFNVNTRFSNWWYNQKNKIIKNIRIQDFLAKFPITSRIARKEGEAIFQLMTGFVDTQILFTFVQSGALKLLEDNPMSVEELSRKIRLDLKGAEILCRAGCALGAPWEHPGAKKAPKIAQGSPRRRQEAQHSAKMGQLGFKMGPQIW